MTGDPPNNDPTDPTNPPTDPIGPGRDAPSRISTKPFTEANRTTIQAGIVATDSGHAYVMVLMNYGSVTIRSVLTPERAREFAKGIAQLADTAGEAERDALAAREGLKAMGIDDGPVDPGKVN